jgi:hypothetical protein
MIRALLVVALAASQAAPRPAPPVPTAWLRERLERLDASRPSEYVALAEDVMDRAPEEADPDAARAVARHLAALAGALDVPGLGRSAALFLAEHATVDAERSRMLAVAGALDPAADRAIARAEAAGAANALLRAFGHYRRGEASRAKEWIARDGAAALLDANPEVLRGGAARFRADCDAMRTAGAPPMSGAQVDALHALVAAAAAGAPRTWSEALMLHGNSPLAEIDVSDPRSTFGVDPSRCEWRDGEWRAPGGPAGAPD